MHSITPASAPAVQVYICFESFNYILISFINVRSSTCLDIISSIQFWLKLFGFDWIWAQKKCQIIYLFVVCCWPWLVLFHISVVHIKSGALFFVMVRKVWLIEIAIKFHLIFVFTLKFSPKRFRWLYGFPIFGTHAFHTEHISTGVVCGRFQICWWCYQYGNLRRWNFFNC